MQAKTKISESYLSDPASNIWDYLSLAAISLCLLVFIVQWRQLPFFLDMYYHLGVAKGFEAAGGISLHNFWEYGPAGCPHIYPPLTHLIILLALKAGISGITIIRSASVIMPLLMLLTLWQITKRMLNKRTAFFIVFLSLCASLFLISTSFTPAASLAAIFLLLGLYCMHKNYIIIAALLFGLIAYTHTGISVLSFVLLLITGILKIINKRSFLKIFFISFIISFPWSIHIINSMPNIIYQATANMPIRIYPIITLLCIIGLYSAIKQFAKCKLLIVLLLSLTPMALIYPFRFLTGQEMISLLVFSGMGLEYIYSLAVYKMANDNKLKQYTSFLTIVILCYLFFFSPSAEYHNKHFRFKMYDSLFASAFEGKEIESKDILSIGFFDANTFDKLAVLVKKYSKKHHFIWCNNRYIAGITGLITSRHTLTHMLLEIQPRTGKPDIRNAELLITVGEKNNATEGIGPIGKKNFDIVAKEVISGMETCIYVNNVPVAVNLNNIYKPIISLRVCLIVFLLYCLLICSYLIRYQKYSLNTH
jgi:hypothetical protein